MKDNLKEHSQSILIRGRHRLYAGDRCLCPAFNQDGGVHLLLGTLFFGVDGVPMIRTLDNFTLIVTQGAHWSIDDAIDPDRLVPCTRISEDNAW